ncbi:MAG: hypothetical protein COX62_05950 [Deltaproteobacteria bacterium CG_4_10_14_0_2_um_filter_43_8]|nr:MAG: hypothetical protein COV43_04890 [Deltaproteobacteria bacterium CG11_big_fil_rev_8_21_14_0_20_42_23]PJA19803.1 MAG: hypothetical protein COX62_05950 [Deltaproteobacteria bacterium CG_4_10_14_0_2_um_filter_43_8]PJC65111.1 MAG: hypothetical protein CO021_01280 [Deltaproteobacteria bacterium CG_4_9_14_0_2_um_filter_42_21]
MSFPSLQTGDTIGIAASSASFDKELFEKGIQVLQSWGFNTFFQEDIFDTHKYFAGTEERRKKEFLSLFHNEQIKAIMFARGGFGSQQFLSELKQDLHPQAKKLVIGFSDLTPLLNILAGNKLAHCFYGPVLTQLNNNNDTDAGLYLKNLLSTGSLPSFANTKAKVIQEGSVKGKIYGGCLSLITSSIGTPYELKLKNDILFLEDVGEKLYQLDRMLLHLKHSGLLQQTSALIVGKTKPSDSSEDNFLNLISEYAKDIKGPVVANFPSGHEVPFFPLPLGMEMKLNASAHEFSLT